MNDKPRLIEHAFPLKQASLDSVHEKNVRHGHISTLHIWPARRPLAACRAALIATLLPDPGNAEERKKLVEKLGGTVIEKIEKKKMPSGKTADRVKEETVGGILHWGRETENKETLDWFRDAIRKAYDGRAPRVLDPFAGGGAIPLEAMRLGCEVTAIDINPVAWFILKCTLEYPQKLAGQKRPLPEFILKDREFMEEFLEAQGFKGKALKNQLAAMGLADDEEANEQHIPGLEADAAKLDADLAWHVRAWGRWVLTRARTDLAKFYPTYADFEPLKPGGKKFKPRPTQILSLKKDGKPKLDKLNTEFKPDYLLDERNPRWIAKPPLAYLWTRTVTCKNCRATMPLLKTRWLCKKDRKRVLLTMRPNAKKTGVEFGIQNDVPVVGGNAAQRREHDKRISAGTMSRSGASCPCCDVIMTKEDIQQEGLSGRLMTEMTTVITEGPSGKEYRRPTESEIKLAASTAKDGNRIFGDIPFGFPNEKLTLDAKNNTWCVLYGVNEFQKLFTPRQLLALGTLVGHTRDLREMLSKSGLPSNWVQAVTSYVALCIDRLADRNSTISWWQTTAQKIGPTFTRWALPMAWDFCEISPWAEASGGYLQAIDWVAEVAEHLTKPMLAKSRAVVLKQSATQETDKRFDIVVTDPPYYDSIGYSVLMDFYYVWLRRVLSGVSPDVDDAFHDELAPKWDSHANDGELIDDASRFGGDKNASKRAYEEGMFRAFESCHRSLETHGRLVIVFAHKHPDAWETLVSAIIRAGFVVDGSWPVQTERVGRTRSVSSAALSSSVWLVCKKRPEAVRPGWDNRVLEEMRENIGEQLREFWDAGIRGPDFVWAATGPAMEVYSQYPVVKKANEPGQLMTVSEFLRQVRRIVVDFVVGRVLSHNGHEQDVSGLDDVTTYYLLHRHDFGMADAPIGPCILYAVSCGLSDNALADEHDILARTGGQAAEEEEEEEAAEAAEAESEEEGTGSTVKLKLWQQRHRPSMGYDPAIDSARARSEAAQMTFLVREKPQTETTPRVIPLIDQIHRLMHLWKAGDVVKVDEYIDRRALRRNALFHQVLQALIELADAGSEERSFLESISNHVAARGAAPAERQAEFVKEGGASEESEA